MSLLTQFKEAGRGDWEQRPDVIPGGVAGALAVPIVVLRYQEALPFSSLLYPHWLISPGPLLACISLLLSFSPFRHSRAEEAALTELRLVLSTADG